MYTAIVFSRILYDKIKDIYYSMLSKSFRKRQFYKGLLFLLFIFCLKDLFLTVLKKGKTKTLRKQFFRANESFSYAIYTHNI